MYKTMHEKVNAKPPAPASSSTPQTQSTNTTPAAPTLTQNAAPITCSSTPAAPAKPTPKLDKTLFDLLTDVTAELIVESAKLDRLGRYLTKNPKNPKN